MTPNRFSMMARRTFPSRAECRLAASLVPSLFGISGCAVPSAPATFSPPVSKPSARAATAGSSFVSSSVQSRPEYVQAKAACRKGDYRKAAHILALLAQSPSFTSEQHSFCLTQEQICRNHFEQPNTNLLMNASMPARSPRLAAASDCGPRALLLACQQMHVPATLPALTAAAGVGPRGTDFQGLKAAAAKFHLQAEGVQTSREALPDLPMPALAWWHGNHFVLVSSLRGRGQSAVANIFDPNESQSRTISQEELLQACSGYLLTLRK